MLAGVLNGKLDEGFNTISLTPQIKNSHKNRYLDQTAHMESFYMVLRFIFLPAIVCQNTRSFFSVYWQKILAQLILHILEDLKNPSLAVPLPATSFEELGPDWVL